MQIRRFVTTGLAVTLVASTLGLGSSANAAASCAPARTGGDWRSIGQNLQQHRNQADEHSIGAVQAATLRPAWTFDANEAAGSENNEVTGYPIVADGCVYVATSTGHSLPGTVFAINADTGAVVWKHELPFGVYSSLNVNDGKVFAHVSRIGTPTTPGPYVIALDQDTGATVWQTTVSEQPGSDAVSSPVVFDGMVWVGVSGTAAEGDESQRFDFHGQSVIMDADTGDVLADEGSIPDEDIAQGFAGGALWSTLSVDSEEKYGYVGSGNPFNYDNEHANTNAVLKIDLDRSRSTFGEIVASYKGDVEEYLPVENKECDEEDPVGAFLAGFECGNLDLDFGAPPQIFKLADGTKVVGAGQKSGVYHVMNADTMEPVWKQIIGVPSPVGGIVGSPAFDGSSIISPHSIGGYMASLNKDTGTPNWIAPTADGVHWGSPVTVANGVAYSADLKGFLDAYDTKTGAPLLHAPMNSLDTGTNPTFTWGGVSVARNTVYASIGVGITSAGDGFPSMPNGFVIAYKPAVGL